METKEHVWTHTYIHKRVEDTYAQKWLNLISNQFITIRLAKLSIFSLISEIVILI